MNTPSTELTIENLESGSYTLKLTPEHHEPVTEDFDITKGETTTVRIYLNSFVVDSSERLTTGHHYSSINSRITISDESPWRIPSLVMRV